METGRSFASLFPISQNQIILPRSQQALRRQEQMRKKEVQLQNQLQFICQRQSDAHRRNQDLLRDFKRIEQELSLLTAKSDSFRRKQKKQMPPFTSEQSKCAAPNSIESTMGRSYSKQFNDFSANYSNLGEPCFPATVGHVGPLPIHFSLYPNQQLGLQGCCNRSLCCGLVHPHCDGQFGNLVPDVYKILDSTLDCQSQKKKCPTSDSSIARDVTFIPNTKKDIVLQQHQHCSGFICDKDSSIKCPTMTTHVHGDPLQSILNSDMYRDWKEKLLKDVQQQMVGGHAVEIAVEQSKEEDSSKKQACHAGSPNSISERSQQPMDALSKSHLLLVSPSGGDHSTKVGSKPSSKRKNNTKLKPANESIPYEITPEQNIEGAHCIEQATITVDHHVLKPSLISSNASGSLVVTGVNEQTNHYKTVENNNLCMDWWEKEIKAIDSSETERVCEKEIGHQDTGYLHQDEKEKDTRFMATFLKMSSEEIIESSEDEIVLPNGSKMFHVVQENKSSSRCRTSEDEHSQVEASVSSHLSVEEKGRVCRTNSAKEKRLEMRKHGLLRKMSSCASYSFPINEDTIKENMKLYMSEQDDESSDQNQSQIKEIKYEDRNLGMLKGGSRLVSSGLSENNTGEVYGVVGESERFREMLTEEIEKSSSEEDNESEEQSEAESSVHEGVGIFTMKEKDIQIKVNEESENEDTGEDRTSEEGEISGNVSKGSPVVIIDAVIHGITNEEQSNIEADKENRLAKKGGSQTECNAGSNRISEEEMSDKTDISDEDRIFSGDISDEIESSEEEENTDFWGSGHEENDSDIEEMDQDVQLQSSSTEDSTKKVKTDVSAREEDPQETAASVLDVPAASCQNLIEDEEVNSEKQRSSWLCCLKTCSLPHILNKSENQPQGKRCSEDGSMDMLQMHPVEFGSSLSAEETLADPIANVHTEDTPAAEINAEDSDEESLHSEKETENHNPAWSDSEDNVHSFYD